MQESHAITRNSASNLALAFILLPKTKRAGMSALYAFCRQVDDIADNENTPVEVRRQELQKWREDIAEACRQGQPRFGVNQELKPIIAACRLGYDLFDELIRGVEMDLTIKRYATYAELEQYCYRVASVVGLLSIQIFGYRNAACRDYANYLGQALQLTNILRDVRSDAERGRIYLPQEELARCGVREEEILRSEYSERFCQAASNVAQQARKFYQLARVTLPPEDRRSMVAAELMASVYWRLLRKLELSRFNVFGPKPASLSKGQKLLLIARTWCQIYRGTMVANYGTP